MCVLKKNIKVEKENKCQKKQATDWFFDPNMF